MSHFSCSKDSTMTLILIQQPGEEKLQIVKAKAISVNTI